MSENFSKCWCGENQLKVFSEHYLICSCCNTLVSKNKMHNDYYKGADNADSLYGKEYWINHLKNDFGYPDIFQLSRDCLTERCVYWLRDILQYKNLSGKTLELGCAHGGLVYLMSLAGYDASGTEMSRWLCDYAHDTFNVPMVCGTLEDTDVPPQSYDMIVLMDVLEHMPDPVDGLNRIASALKDDGVLVIQTPCWRETEKSYEQMKTECSIFLQQLKEKEHLYLFNQNAIETILKRTGFSFLSVERPIFAYDMFIFAGKQPLVKRTRDGIESDLLKTPQGRIVLALIDFYKKLADCEMSCAAKTEEIERQSKLISKLLNRESKDCPDNSAAISAIKSSYCWKITAPFRWIGDLITKR